MSTNGPNLPESAADAGAAPTPDAPAHAPAAPAAPPEPKPTLPDIRRAARLDLIRQMLPMHRTQIEMANACGVSERTIRNDIAYLRREMAEEVATLTAEKVAADARGRMRQLMKLAFDELIPRKAKDGKLVHLPTRDKIALLNTIRQLQQAEIKLLQSLGVIYRAPQQVQILTLAMDRLNALSPQVQAQIAEASSEPAVFERLLVQHIGAEFAGAMLGKPVAVIGAGAVAQSDAADLADVDDAEAVEPPESVESVVAAVPHAGEPSSEPGSEPGSEPDSEPSSAATTEQPSTTESA